ncbi:helix-turn-helix domain-containing protein [Shewanella xiamenensis]|uniref:helix-turn-helix domain-containing protein n=1 Tax=Shewanella xiamenensis TaxID=332186 RepID=UPI0015585BF1|nr:XRE family transcriptional regulator [Shewanella xiamenensis]MCL1070844.1 XRE family transcriptional regulator [Shewanella xiamenensis]MEE1979467.1 XRE family transcriptional regulator [Shewanella xiamenensis]WHF55367.1 XRE family transcriptional regulator [Shewanella xiamenensis]GGM89911.1 DNA-binding protein [Shewanella xiamenensis]
MQTINSYLAATLKQLRSQKGWSLDKAALETGVSKAMIGQIERGESSPTIATLWKIASGFNTSLSTFLEPTPESQGTVFRNADALRQKPATDGMLVASLFPFEPRFGFEMFELTLLPHYERLSEPHEAGVTEHVIVLSGTMEVLVDGQWQPLQQGEAVRFAADKPHGYRNLSDQPVVFHDLIHYHREAPVTE